MNIQRRSRPSPLLTLAAAAGLALAIVIARGPGAASAASPDFLAPRVRTLQAARPSSLRLVQDSDDDADSEVPPEQVEKYVAVYTDMQRDRSLTVDAAAAKEGLTVAQFRDLEQKIERDDVARDHVRSELQSAATAKP